MIKSNKSSALKISRFNISCNIKRLEMEKEERKRKGKETDWGIDYHGSVRFDNYYMPQINLKPAYIFFDSDYYTY